MARSRKSKASGSTTATDIPLAHPNFSSLPTGKTLLELADERRGIRVMEVDSNGTTSEPRIVELNSDDELEEHNITKEGKHEDKEGMKGAEEEEEEEEGDGDGIPPLATAIMYTITLCAVHTTLDVIVLTQYSQDMSVSSILGRLVRLAPALLLVLYVLHQPLIIAWPRARQLFFFGTAIGAGCWLFYAGNEYGYYHVMKRAPPLGTLWVWSVVEMDLTLILLHLVIVGGYMFINGYGSF